MLISATQDVAEHSLETLAGELREVGHVDVAEHRIFFKSAEPPSWIAIFEQIPSWVVLLGPSAAVFLRELLKEAAKDLWRNKQSIARAVVSSPARALRTFAEAIATFRRGTSRTHVDVAIPRPDDYFGTRLRLEGRDAAEIALELALFVHHCGALQALLDEVERGEGVAAQVSLTLHDDGSMSVAWQTKGRLQGRGRTLPPPAP